MTRSKTAWSEGASPKWSAGCSGISHGVISRIESAGVSSIRELSVLGVDTVVDQICRGVGNLAWRNRKRALSRALARLDSLGV